MTSIKALCVLLFLFLRIDKSLNLKNNSSPAKRTIVLEKVKQNAHKIGKTIRRKLREPGLGNIYIEQFAYIYLQPEGSQDVIYDNAIVKSVYAGTGATKMTATVWPDQGEESNFRMAVPIRPDLHAEAQLLANDGLDNMISRYYTTAGNRCPQYIIIDSLLLPCNFCADEIIAASGSCNGTPLHLYVQKPEYTNSRILFNNIREKLIDPQTGIIWINDPGERTRPIEQSS